jgi:hypothetical protein
VPRKADRQEWGCREDSHGQGNGKRNLPGMRNESQPLPAQQKVTQIHLFNFLYEA